MFVGRQNPTPHLSQIPCCCFFPSELLPHQSWLNSLQFAGIRGKERLGKKRLKSVLDPAGRAQGKAPDKTNTLCGLFSCHHCWDGFYGAAVTLIASTECNPGISLSCYRWRQIKSNLLLALNPLCGHRAPSV